MRERLCPTGVVAAYVWDYKEGMDLLHHFWSAAIAMDPTAAALDESRRFALCEAAPLASLLRDAGLVRVEVRALDVPLSFQTFTEYWTPFLGGTGPAPAYVASLDPERRETLRLHLQQRLQPEAGGPIRLRARAWAVRGHRA
jgi:hypothetical protein